MGIYPVPIGRNSQSLTSRRLVAQLQAEQNSLIRVQEQISTGQRMTKPSEDTPAASRAVALQRMIELKTQFNENLATNQSYLDASDTALSDATGMLADVRALAVRAADSTTSDSERNAIALEIDATIEQLQNVANTSFRGRYLFAGSESDVRPFETVGNHVSYEGNDVALRGLFDVNMLVDTSMPGQDLFGAVSNEVQGRDLNPVLTEDTRLADLRGGQGITKGGIIVSDGTNRSTVDISQAETLGDLKQLMEANPPAGRDVQVTIGDAGLRIEMDLAGGGSLIVRDEPGGRTARDLGLFRLSGSVSDPIEGDDLDPMLRLTTQLSDMVSWDQSSGLQIRNGGSTYLVDLQEATTVEDLLNTLNSSEAHLLAEISDDARGINLRSRLSGTDFSVGENGGTTASDLGLRSMTLDTALADLNHQQGVRTGEEADFMIQRTDGVTLEVDISDARTVGDVVDQINQHPDNLDPATRVNASLREFGNGIELTDDNPAGTETLSVSRGPLSFAVWDLGLVAEGAAETTASDVQPATAATASLVWEPPSNINNQIQLTAAETGTAWNDVQIEFIDGASTGDVAVANYDPVGKVLQVDVDPTATKANTVVNAINLHGAFVAALDLSDDPTNDGTGLVTQTGTIATTADGTAATLSGQDVNPIEVDGVFNSLIRLKTAVQDYDSLEIQRLAESLDADFDRVNFGRASLAARAQGFDTLQNQHDTEQIELQSALSEEIDVDLVAAISEATARQATYEASLRMMANLYRVSLLDFI